MVTSYTSNLKAILSVSRKESRPESLSQALENPRMQFLTSRGTSPLSLLMNSKTESYHEAWKRIEPYPKNIIVMQRFTPDGLERVENAKVPLALIFQGEIMARYIATKAVSRLYIVKEPLRTDLGRMIYRRNFRYSDMFNREIKQLRETGT